MTAKEQYLLDNIEYNPFTGDLYWKPTKQNKTKAGTIVGARSKCSSDYITLNTPYGYLKAHRVAWFLYYYKWPKGMIDHINGCRRDNRIDNLRDVSCSENCMNSEARISNKTGVKGVYWKKRNNKYVVQKRGKHIGLFATLEQAQAAYEKAD